MSVQFDMLCRDCLQQAPPLGDGGYIGAPSLSPQPQAVPEFATVVPTFAHLYEPLAAIGLRSYESERFRQWLEEHQDHRVVLYSEQAPPEAEMVTSRPDWRREVVQEQRRQEAARAAALDSGAFVEALYVLTCKHCDAQLTSSEPDAIRAFDALSVTPSAVALLEDRWSLIERWVYRQIGVMNETEAFFRELPAFLKAHLAHGVQASLSGEGA